MTRHGVDGRDKPGHDARSVASARIRKTALTCARPGVRSSQFPRQNLSHFRHQGGLARPRREEAEFEIRQGWKPEFAIAVETSHARRNGRCVETGYAEASRQSELQSFRDPTRSTTIINNVVKSTPSRSRPVGMADQILTLSLDTKVNFSEA
jgi:hypothetical protein